MATSANTIRLPRTFLSLLTSSVVALAGGVVGAAPTADPETTDPSPAGRATIELDDDDDDLALDASAPSGAEETVSGSGREAELEARLEAVSERLEALEARAAEAEEARRAAEEARAEAEAKVRSESDARDELESPPTKRERHSLIAIGFNRSMGVKSWGLRLSGYTQVQYQWSQLSEDEVLQGVPLNRNRFMIRRGRLQLNGDWKWVASELQVDGSTTRGPFVGIRQAHVSFLWRNPDLDLPPYVMVTAGLTEVPFGWEVRLGQRAMPFMERSLGSLAFFPGPVDIGLRLRGGVGPLRYDFALMNGSPLDDRAGADAGIDPTSAPDYAGRLGFEVHPSRLSIAGGASFLYGTGFHAGHPATKNHVVWQDLNENGRIDSGELVSVPGQAATPSFTFKRWAVGADLQIGLLTKAGWSSLFAEASMGSNLDRGLFVSDPIATGADLRQLQAYVAYVQDFFGWAIAGARYDFYDPDVDLLDNRRGVLVPRDGAIHTLSPLAGVLLPDRLAPGFRGRLVIQYDAIWDALGRDPRGVPADARNDQLTIRLQGEF